MALSRRGRLLRGCGALAVSFVLWSAVQAAAEEKPPLFPDRDVDITYEARVGDKMVKERVRWKAADRIERIDAVGRFHHPYILIDHRDQRVDFVDPRTRSVIEEANTAAGELGEIANATFTPLGEAKIAGFVCREWEAVISSSARRQVCFTEDGVLLRVRAGDQVLLLATRVRYRKLAESYFDIPPNYKPSPSGQASPMPFYGSP
jgi:hypothetical protein